MKDPNLKVDIKHSESKTAWNIVGMELGKKHKIARIPYVLCGNEELDTMAKSEALHHAQFIEYCFNYSEQILNKQ